MKQNLINYIHVYNETLNRKKGKRDFPKEFKLTNGNTISEPKEIANAFNDFFVSIGDTGVLNTNWNIDFLLFRKIY